MSRSDKSVHRHDPEYVEVSLLEAKLSDFPSEPPRDLRVGVALVGWDHLQQYNTGGCEASPRGFYIENSRFCSCVNSLCMRNLCQDRLLEDDHLPRNRLILESE